MSNQNHPSDTDMRSKKEPLVWAHRGASGYCPENTLPAFAKAAELRADGIELDIQLTRDGELVVCHDEKVDRTSSGSGWIKDMTLEELQALDFSCGNEAFAGETIPTMRQVFDLLAPTNLSINIELKTGIVFYPGIEEKILGLTEECGFGDRVIYSSFNHYTIRRMRELAPHARLGFLYADGIIDMPAYGEKYGVNALHPALYNIQFPGFMEDCKKRDLAVHVWTVNEEEYMRMCCRAGVDAIISNYPDRVRNVIEEMR